MPNVNHSISCKQFSILFSNLKKMYTCIIIDDDIFSIKILQQLLLNCNYLMCIKQFTEPSEAIAYLEENVVDIIFLDIEMPEMTGFELKNKISSNLKIIITTSHSNFALDAFNNNISDYLVKPISFPRLDQAIKKVIKELGVKRAAESNSINENIIVIKHKNKNHKLSLNDIIYIESKEEYVCYNTKTDKIIDYARLKNVEKILPKEMFIRIHKSFIINKNSIKSYNAFFVNLINDVELPVGRVWRNQFVQEFIEIQNKYD